MEKTNTALFSGFDFIGLRRLALVVATVLAVVATGCYISFKGFTLGTDFAGGLRVEFTAPASIEELRTIITGNAVSITTLQTGSMTSFLLTAPATDQQDGAIEAYIQPLREKYGSEEVTIVSSSFVGPSVGYGFSLQALRLVSIVSLLILIYVAFRFNYIYGLGAIASSIHDILVMIAAVIIFRIPIDLTVMAAFLTILGYSINDTIVIFDRVRENHAFIPEEDLAPIINKSISQCMTRTILTSLTTLFVAVAIFIWAGASLRNFGLLMIIGIISGTYSSLFVAAPTTYFFWKLSRKKNEKKSNKVLTKDLK
ncbi:MAG: protein translocase subunit SecF [Brevinema sp.]